MKNMSKLMSLVLAVAMLLSMAVMVSADVGSSLTVTGTNTSIEYTLYKMFIVTKAANGGYKYEVTSEWADFSADDYFSVENNYVIWKKNTTSHADAAAVAELAKDYVNAKGLTSSLKVKVGETINDLENGYYLLMPNDGSTCGVKSIYGDENVSVVQKTAAPGLPNVEKKVQEDSTLTFGDANDADIGQVINFHATITAGDGASHYILHDKMASVFDFGDVTSITRGGNIVATSEYSVVTNPGESCGCTFHVVFNDTFCAGLAEGAKLVVNYTASLNNTAVVDTEYVNETWMTHTKENVESNHDTTITKTYQFTVYKEDGDHNRLGNAGFVLMDTVGKFYKREDGLVTWVDNKEDAEIIMTDDTGVAVFYGIDAENFTLLEEVVPVGYTGQTDTAISTKSGSNSAIIINKLGTALPETGGIGTTVFYIAGGLMVLAAAALLLTKKRASA